MIAVTGNNRIKCVTFHFERELRRRHIISIGQELTTIEIAAIAQQFDLRDVDCIGRARAVTSTTENIVELFLLRDLGSRQPQSTVKCNASAGIGHRNCGRIDA